MRKIARVEPYASYSYIIGETYKIRPSSVIDPDNKLDTLDKMLYDMEILSRFVFKDADIPTDDGKMTVETLPDYQPGVSLESQINARRKDSRRKELEKLRITERPPIIK